MLAPSLSLPETLLIERSKILMFLSCECDSHWSKYMRVTQIVYLVHHYRIFIQTRTHTPSYICILSTILLLNDNTSMVARIVISLTAFPFYFNGNLIYTHFDEQIATVFHILHHSGAILAHLKTCSYLITRNRAPNVSLKRGNHYLS